MLAKKTSKNQLTLPREIVKEFPEIDYFDVAIKNKTIVLTPVQISPLNRDLDVIRDKLEKLGINQNTVPDAVKWARKRKQ
jgi:hypothetical protein